MFGSERYVAELLKARYERKTETLESIAVSSDGGALADVEAFAYFFYRMNTVVKIKDEGSDGSLEINIVFPKRIVRIDEQGLAGHARRGFAFWN